MTQKGTFTRLFRFHTECFRQWVNATNGCHGHCFMLSRKLGLVPGIETWKYLPQPCSTHYQCVIFFEEFYMKYAHRGHINILSSKKIIEKHFSFYFFTAIIALQVNTKKWNTRKYGSIVNQNPDPYFQHYISIFQLSSHISSISIYQTTDIHYEMDTNSYNTQGIISHLTFHWRICCSFTFSIFWLNTLRYFRTFSWYETFETHFVSPSWFEAPWISLKRFW